MDGPIDLGVPAISPTPAVNSGTPSLNQVEPLAMARLPSSGVTKHVQRVTEVFTHLDQEPVNTGYY